MKKQTMILALAGAMLLTACNTQTGAGAYVGASLGSVLGSAIGGIVGGPRGSDIGTVVGMAGGAAVGAAAADAAGHHGRGGRRRHHSHDPVTRTECAAKMATFPVSAAKMATFPVSAAKMAALHTALVMFGRGFGKIQIRARFVLTRGGWSDILHAVKWSNYAKIHWKKRFS